MELSIFLAKLFGIYLLVVGALFALRGKVIVEVVEEMLASRPMLLLSGFIALIIGIAMVISHSVWEPNWRVLITLIGYLSFIKGVTRIGFPELPKKAVGFARNRLVFQFWIGFIVLLGAYLTWLGFTTTV